MNKTKWLLLLALCGLALTFNGCGKDDAPSPGPNPDGGKVSLYEARQWDGVKRGDVYYEIFVRSFADSNGDKIGDLKGITDKLDYLDGLGVSGIWLTPIFKSPSYHGYDVEDYTAINPEYGTMADFEALVAKAHSLKIKVVLDFVINHTSKTHPWFTDACSSTSSAHRDWFIFCNASTVSQDIAAGNVPMTKAYYSNEWHTVETGTTAYKYQGMFSGWMPEINYGSVETCENTSTFGAICHAGRFWLGKGVDGFRLDAVKHVYQDGASDENPRFLEKFFNELKKTKSNLYMVGEVFGEHNETAPYYRGLPALFEFSGWWRLDYAINNSHAKWFPKDMLQYASEYRAVRSDFIQSTKLSNHDEDRTRSTLKGDIRKAKLAAAVLLTIPGQPYVYYGEEIGMLGTKSEGDEGVREPFLWEPLAKDTYRTGWRASKFSNDYNVGNVSTQKVDPTSIYRLYEKFIELRNTYPALATGEMKLLDTFNDGDNSDKKFMVYTREAAGEKLLIVHNVSESRAVYPFTMPVKKAIADFGGVKLQRLSETLEKADMPAYTTIICEL